MVPKEVIIAASELIQMFGDSIELIGQHDGRDVYQFVFPEDQELGFPVAFLYKQGQPVETVTGHEALAFIASVRVE